MNNKRTYEEMIETAYNNKDLCEETGEPSPPPSSPLNLTAGFWQAKEKRMTIMEALKESDFRNTEAAQDYKYNNIGKQRN